MNAKTQKILSYCGIGLVALFAIVLIVPSFINWNQYKDEMKTILENATGRDIEIAGDLSFTLVPTPAFSASGVTIGNIDGGKAEHFANIKRVDIRISFMPLIRGRVAIESLLLDTPLVSLEKFDEDTNNWTFGSETKTTDAPSSTRGNEQNLKVDNFILQNGHLRYSDATSGESYSFEGVSARIKASSTNGPFEGNLAFLYKGIPLQAKGTLGAINKGRRTPLNITAVINNERPGLSMMGSVLLTDTSNDFTLRLRGEGKNLNTLVVGLQTITGDSTKIPVNIRQNWDINSQIAKTGNKYSLTPTSFRIGKTSANLALEYTQPEPVANGDKSPDTSSLKLTINSIEGVDWKKSTGSTNITPAANTRKPNFKFTLPENLSADMEISIGAFNVADGLMRQIALRGRLDKGILLLERGQVMLPGGADIIAAGALTTLNQNPEFKGTIKASANNLRGTLGWAGVDLSTVPDGVLTGFSLNSGITANQQSIALYDAKGQLDISEFDLGFTMGLEPRTRLAIKGKVNRLNIDAYQKPSTSAKTTATLSQSLETLKAKLTPLSGFDASWDIKAYRLNVAAATLEGVASKGSLIDDQLSLDKLAINSFEGMIVDVKGRAFAVSTNPSFNFIFELKAKNPQGFVRWSGVKLGVETRDLGQLALSGTLKGSFDDLDMNLKGQALRASFTTRGTIQAPFDNPGDMALRYNLKHPSHLDVIRRLKLPLTLIGASKPFDISGAIDGPWNSFDLTSNVTALGGKLGWAGIIKTDAPKIAIEGNFDIEHDDLTQLLKSVNVPFTPRDPKKVGGTRLTGHIVGNQDNFSLTKLGGTIGKSRIEGGLAIQPLNAAQPQNGKKNINGRVSISRINLSDYLSQNTSGVSAAKKAGGKRWSDKPLGWNWLANHQLTFALQADQLQFGNYEMKDLSLGLSMKDGVLQTTELAALLFDGQLSGETNINLSRVPSLTQSFRLANAKLTPLMVAATGLSTLSGTLNLGGNFTAIGDSQQAMISSLEGTGNFTATDGVIRGINLGKLSSDIPSATKLTSFVRVLGGSLGKGQTTMKNLTATFTATKGVISAPDIKGGLDKSTLTGDMTFDLPKWTMAGKGRLALTEPPNLPGIGATISGSFADPKKKFTTSEITAYMAKKLTQKMLEKLLRPSTPKPATPENAQETTTQNPAGAAGGGTATGQAPAKTNEEKAKSLLKGIRNLIDKNKKKPVTTDPKTDPKTQAPKT